MTPERWKQVETLYHAALELPPDKRSAYFNEACAGDEELRREVESLLDSHEQAGTFIESPPDDVAVGMIAEEQANSIIGRTLGHYKLQSLLGAGGMGEVYRARDLRLDRDVAVKILPEQFANDAEALRRFEREAKAVAALSHPNILSIFDFGVEQGLSYAVMELLEGQTLRERLNRSAMNWREAVGIGIAIAEGLSATHARGVIHRDLKPGNIFLTSDGQVKILDFGLARMNRAISPDAETVTSAFARTTTPGLVMGTIGYMSPEQVRGEAVEVSSDIFSLGCVMYEALSGQRPFAHDTAAEVIAAILKEEPPSLLSYAAESPAELDRVVNKTLRKDRRERYQTAGELLDDLKNLRLESELEARMKSSGHRAAIGASNPTEAPTLRFPTPNSVATAKRMIGSALAILVLVLGGWRAYRKGDAVRLVIESNVDGYLYVFHTENDSSPQMLFSDSRLRGGGNRIAAHTPYETPSSREPDPRHRWFVFDEKSAIERLYVVVTKQPLPNIPTGRSLVAYCQSNPEGCPWRPPEANWKQVAANADAPAREDSSAESGQALTAAEAESLERGLGLGLDAPAPSVIRISQSPQAKAIAAVVRLNHK